MKKHIVKVLKTGFVTPNVKRFVVEKPGGYKFIPGQGTAVSVNEPKFRKESKPFTFVSVNESDHLEFLVKFYTGHYGLMERLVKVKAGDELILHEAFGSIRYEGPGLFIAGGTGITPFIAIFRQLESEDQLAGNSLLFANRTADDIIMKDELKEMLGGDCVNILEISNDPGMKTGFIGSKLLKQYKTGDEGYYYICGPDKFTIIIVKHLLSLGIRKSKIIFDKQQIIPPLSYTLLTHAISFN